MSAKKFNTPFALLGDKVEIPTTAQVDGSVSFQQGYPFGYEADYTDPNTKDISRSKTNQLLFDITNAIREIQQGGVSEWSEEGKPYKINSLVYAPDGTVKQSLIANNNNDTTHSSWSNLINASILPTLDTQNVELTGNQTIAGVKTFSSSPIVPTPTAGTQAVNKDYVDALDSGNVKLTSNQTIAGVKTFTSSPIVPTPTTGTQAVNKNYVDNITALPIGTILNAYTIFDNCIVAFGGEFNRADYPKLWAYLQANPTLLKTQAQWQTESTANGGICGFFSDGNGTTTFRVPNLDKAFLRPDSRGVGSYQGDAIRNIEGKIISQPGYTITGTSGAFTYTVATGNGVNSASAGRIHTFNFNASNVVPTANENRPKNIAVLPLIVAK